jgi:ketosteroid isomerase-like protein
MSKANVEIVRALWKARNRGDREAALARFAAGCEFDYSSSKGLSPVVVRGLEDFTRRLDEGAEVWDEPRWEADEFIDAGDAVVVPGRFRGRGRGSGVEIGARAVEVFWLTEGKVVRWRLCQSRGEALEAVGLRQ